MENNELPLPPTPPPGGPPSVPVVTGAPAVPTNAQQPARSSMLDRLREQVMKDILPDENEQFRRNVGAFGRGMLTSSGNFFQRFGAGDAAVAQQQQALEQARANRLKAGEEDEVQRARIAVLEAEQRLKENPNSWQAQVAFMNARAHLLQAAAAQRDRVTSQQRDREGNLYNVHESGRITRVGGENGPSFMDPDRSPEARRYADWARQKEAFEGRLLARPPALAETPEQRREADAAAMRQWLASNPRPRAPWDERTPAGAGGEVRPPAETSNRNAVELNLNTGRTR